MTRLCILLATLALLCLADAPALDRWWCERFGGGTDYCQCLWEKKP